MILQPRSLFPGEDNCWLQAFPESPPICLYTLLLMVSMEMCSYLVFSNLEEGARGTLPPPPLTSPIPSSFWTYAVPVSPPSPAASPAPLLVGFDWLGVGMLEAL